MSHIITTEAIVLRSIKYSETSKIVTLFTKELGRIGAIAKGVRKKEGKQGATFEPMSIVDVVLYVKEGREVQTIGQYAQVKSFHNIAENLDQLSVGLSLIEILNSIAHEQEPNSALYDLLKECLLTLETITPDASHVMYYFEIKTAELLGFTPVFESCSDCKKAIGQSGERAWTFYDIKTGAPVCEDCLSGQTGIVRLSGLSLRIMQKLLKYSTVREVTSPHSVFSNEIEDFLTRYLTAHATGFRPPRARTMFKQNIG